MGAPKEATEYWDTDIYAIMRSQGKIIDAEFEEVEPVKKIDVSV